MTLARAVPRLLRAVLALTVLLPVSASAQGWIEPRPGFGAIERLRTTVNVRITDRVALVEVEEWFRNNGGALGEGDYMYPLPGEAVFSSYSLYQGDQELRGEMMEGAQAREIYERIVRSRRDPALIELVGKGMVRARVFPIEPGQTRRITLRFTQVLDRAGDALQYRYAAGARTSSDVVLARGKGDRPLTTGAPVTFTVAVENASRFRDAVSPTHSIDVTRVGSRMMVRPRNELSGDFAVLLPFAEPEVGVSLVTHRPQGEDGYFMLTLSPGDAPAVRVSRDVTVVVDVSGSMSGEKIDQARRALHQLLGSLAGEDRVRLISFSSVARSWRESWTPATRENLRLAREWVDDLEADGGTNIHDALASAFSAASPASRLPVVVFMTDGLPTNGETQPERIAQMAETKRGRARVFAFGVGYDVNTVLLDRLSEAARGTTQYVRPGEDVEQAVSVLAAKVKHPVLTDIALERGPVRITEIYPRNLPDLFAGDELIIFGRYEGTGTGAVGVNGRRGDRPERYATDARFPARANGNEFIPRLWAARKLGDLDRRIRAAQADGASRKQVDDMIDELRKTALRYGLLSEYTSYLVLEPGMSVTEADAFGRVGSARGAAIAPPPAASGQAAVSRAEEARRARSVGSLADIAAVQSMSAERMESAKAAGARMIAGRSFTQRNGVWEDSGHRAQRVVAIEPFSAAYFTLLNALPELGPVLKALDSVVIAGERVSVKVGAGGAKTLSDAQIASVVTEFRTK